MVEHLRATQTAWLDSHWDPELFVIFYLHLSRISGHEEDGDFSLPNNDAYAGTGTDSGNCVNIQSIAD